MALASVLLYLAVLYIRPGEVVPGWIGFPFAAITQSFAFLMVLVSLFLNPRSFWSQPHDRYLLGFFIATLVSNVAWGWFGGIFVAVMNTGPQLLCYFLLRAAIRSPRDLRMVGAVIVAVTLFLALNGISQFRTGVGLGNVDAIDMHVDADTNEDGEQDQVRRIRGTGIFNDPNDLAMAFVVIVPLLVGPIVRSQTPFMVRGVAAAVLAPIVVALYYTNSRGGILALGALLMPYGWRLGRVFGTVAAVAALTAVVALGPSRMNQLDSEDSSAQGRVQSWSEGLQMFKSRPIFGVGYGRYTEFNPLVAHNSFVHTLAEVGIIGAFFFTGMIYWLFRGTPRVRHLDERPPGMLGLSATGDDLRRGALGMCVCMMFLSRQYSSVLFNWLALSACYHQLLQESDSTVHGEGVMDPVWIGLSTVGGIVLTYVFVRTFALWGG